MTNLCGERRREGMLDSDDVRTLSDLGFLALSRGLRPQARTIFEGVKAARPTQEAGFIGAALVCLADGQIEEAVKILRGLPPTDSARVFLGIALARHGDQRAAREIFQEILEASPDTPYANLARATLDSLGK